MKYPKVLNLGDPSLENLFKGPVVVEEKVDGSQFRVWFDPEGKIHFGSKAVDYDDEHPPDRMFVPAIAEAEKHFSTVSENLAGFFFVFEYLATAQQNALTYGRIPKDHLVLLEIYRGGRWLDRPEKERWANTLGFEFVPILAQSEIKSPDELERLLETQSFLGGVTVEGLVIKNYGQFHTFSYLAGAPVFGKLVRDEFRELNRQVWGEGKSLEERIMEHFPLEPRWEKTVQHLRDEGRLGHGVKDIGMLMREVEADFEAESKALVQELLWTEFAHGLRKRSRMGFAEWYKQRLLRDSMDPMVG
ncbi:hypothetical protein HY994_06690 [Candidatus Micrarchaeota archaeon]|nr:hypothetical protein [Candidatus Micrarchaeota archaeon]